MTVYMVYNFNQKKERYIKRYFLNKQKALNFLERLEIEAVYIPNYLKSIGILQFSTISDYFFNKTTRVI